MTVSYRGHKIDVHRARANAGYSLLYFSIFRESDLFECHSSYEDSAERIVAKVAQLKRLVDEELKSPHPWAAAPPVEGL